MVTGEFFKRKTNQLLRSDVQTVDDINKDLDKNKMKIDTYFTNAEGKGSSSSKGKEEPVQKKKPKDDDPDVNFI